jgi:hypothetical protein
MARTSSTITTMIAIKRKLAAADATHEGIIHWNRWTAGAGNWRTDHRRGLDVS